MFIPDPDFYPSRIPYPKTATKERGEKKFVVILFYVATNFTKIENYFSLKVLRKKVWPNFQRIIKLFTQTIVTKLSKILVWDPNPGSEIRNPENNLFRTPDSGVKDPGSRSATLLVILIVNNKNKVFRGLRGNCSCGCL